MKYYLLFHDKNLNHNWYQINSVIPNEPTHKIKEIFFESHCTNYFLGVAILIPRQIISLPSWTIFHLFKMKKWLVISWQNSAIPVIVRCAMQSSFHPVFISHPSGLKLRRHLRYFDFWAESLLEHHDFRFLARCPIVGQG